MFKRKMRVAVIGAGASGLCAAKHLASESNRFDFVVYEQCAHIGGTWVYTDKVGIDENGLEVHTSMYKSLRTNLPKEVMGYPDFPIPEEGFSYLPGPRILEFLHSYCTHFNLERYILFNHHVQNISVRNNTWIITVVDLTCSKEFEEEFDAVMVCNGHYWKPRLPNIKGSNKFDGIQFHSHDYRTPDIFQDKTVLLIGAGPSGLDLVYEVSKVAKKVIWSHRSRENIVSTLPDNVEIKGEVSEILTNGPKFKDGSLCNTDIVFYCTGYLYDFPFLAKSGLIKVEDNYVQPLYKHMIHIDHPTLCLIGLPYYVCAFSMFDLQVRVFLKYLNGSLKLPSADEMRKDTENDMKTRRALGLCNRHAHMMGNFQEKYYSDLAQLANVTGIPPVMSKLHIKSNDRMLEDVKYFREDVYKIIDDETYIRIK